MACAIGFRTQCPSNAIQMNLISDKHLRVYEYYLHSDQKSFKTFTLIEYNWIWTELTRTCVRMWFIIFAHGQGLLNGNSTMRNPHELVRKAHRIQEIPFRCSHGSVFVKLRPSEQLERICGRSRLNVVRRVINKNAFRRWRERPEILHL